MNDITLSFQSSFPEETTTLKVVNGESSSQRVFGVQVSLESSSQQWKL